MSEIMSKNQKLSAARQTKNDEFYTRLSDIEKEIGEHPDYWRQFKDKVVYCNCDDPEISNFVKFFVNHFSDYGLRKLLVSHYNLDHSPSYAVEYTGERGEENMFITIPMSGDGDFRSDECVELLKQCDIVVTNPPFSLFREYVAQLVEYDKKFLIIADKNCITYKDFFPLLKDDYLRLGYNFVKEFDTPDGEVRKFGNVGWFTNLDIDKHNEPILLTETYAGNEDKYCKYDNYDAININRIKDIPADYDGAMGVPISFMESYNPEQFEILGISGTEAGPVEVNGVIRLHPGRFYVNGKRLYDRIVIRKRQAS